MRKQGGVGSFNLLTLIFIVLKLSGYINWSWVWVLSPLWVTVILIIILKGIVWLTRDKTYE